MTNPSIFAAFERMWQHVLNIVSNKADTDHSHSWNELADKPFGETGEVSMIKILDTNDIIGNENIESSTIGEAPHWESYEIEDGRTVHSTAFYLPGELLKVGSEYVVNIDGTELTAVCVDDNSGGGPGAVIGEEREDAELPYYFYMGLCATPDYPTNYYEVGVMCESEPSQITIYEKDPEIKKIDPKYLPEGGVGYAETKSGFDAFDIIQFIYDATEQLPDDVFEMVPPEESPTGKLFITGHLEAPAFPFDIVAGNEYVISVNGLSYTSTAVAMEQDGTEVVCFGDANEALSGNFANFRFLVTQGKFDGGEFLGFNFDAESFYMNSAPDSLFIYCPNQEEIIHKIDPKYLPEGGVGYVTTEAGIETFDIVKITNDLLESDNGYGGLEAVPPEESPTGTLFIYGELVTSELPFKLIAGQEYKVSINNISYTSTAVVRTERNEEDGEVFEYVCIGDIDKASSENIADLRFAIIYDELDGESNLITMINGGAFDLTDVPAEINISCPGQIEVVHKIDQKFLPQISSDWNENNPDAAGYIKNRPFGDCLIETAELLPKETFTIINGYTQISDSLTFIEGKTYKVVFNGETYECVAWAWSWGSGDDAIIIGNGNICGSEGMGEDVPFSCDSYSDGSCYLNVFDNGDYTIRIAALENEITKIDKKFLPDDIGSNTDWNQNDESAPDYIKNRPFYEELVAKEVIFDEDGYIVESGTQISDSMVFTEGETYLVTFNDVTYQCVAWSVAIDVQDYTIYLGNGATIGINDKDNGEPFLLESSASYGCNLYVPEEMGFSLKIETTEAVVHKIDSKFLPDDIGSVPDWNQCNKTAPDYIKNRPFSEDIYFNFDTDKEYESIEYNANILWKLSDNYIDPEEIIGAKLSGYNYVDELISINCIVEKIDDAPFGEIGCYAVNLANGYEHIDVPIVVSNGESPYIPCGIWLFLEPTFDFPFTLKLKAQKIKKLDKKFLEPISWNELTDKPFEYEEKFEWDSEVEYEEIITDEEYGYSMIKISSNIPSDKEKFVGGRVYAVSDGEYFEAVMNEFYIESFPDSDDVYYVAQNFMVVESDETSLDGLTITKGVWFFPYTDEPYTKIGIATALKKIDPSVLYDPYYYEKGDLIFEDQVTTEKSSEDKLTIKGTLSTRGGLNLKLNTNYIVEVNGKEYLCKTKSVYNDNECLGNEFFVYVHKYVDSDVMSLEQAEQFVSSINIFEDTGEPFCLYYGDYYPVIYTKIAGDYLINIYECTTKKINEAYLPDRYVLLPEDLYNSRTHVCYYWNKDETYETVVRNEENTLEFVKISNDYSVADLYDKVAYITAASFYEELLYPLLQEDFVDCGGYYTWGTDASIVVVTDPSVEVFDNITLTRGLWINLSFTPINSLLITDKHIVLDKYAIPGTIARVKHTISTPKTAQVGQTLVVKTVDTDGRPTSWECVGLPGNGSKYGKLVVFGDSLGEGTNNDNYSFVDVLSESGMFSSVVKACKSSATIGPYSGEYAVGYDLNSQIERYASDVADADIILCEYQFNDIFAVANGDIKIGQKDDADTETTICGYARKALKRIRELNPTAHITWLPSVVSDFNLIPFETNVKDGIHLFEMTVLSMAKEFGVGFISIMEEMSNESLMSSDGGHPNTLGHKRIAQVILHNLYGNSDIPRQERLLILSGDYNNQSTLAIDGDPSIIAQLMRAGVDVRLAWDSGTGGIIFNAVFADNRAIIFRADGGTHGGFTVTWGMDGNIYFIQENSICLPPVTAEDEGKILRVVNGVPTWVSLPYAEEAEF